MKEIVIFILIFAVAIIAFVLLKDKGEDPNLYLDPIIERETAPSVPIYDKTEWCSENPGKCKGFD